MQIMKYAAGPLLGITMVLLCWAVIEYGMRWYYQDVSVGSGGTPGAADFYKKYYQGNAHGWRDQDYELKASAETVRIGVLGDSFTFGGGIKDPQDTWPRIMENALRENFPKLEIQVLNAARRGATVENVRDILKNQLLQYDPDIVVYAYNLNDVETEDDKGRVAAGSQLFTGERGRALVEQYYTAYALERLYAGLNSETNYDSYLKSMYASASHMEYVKRALQQIREAADGKTLLIGVLPNAKIGSDYSMQKEHDQVLQVLDELEIEHIDLLPQLPAKSPKEYRVSLFDYHPNEDMQGYFAQQFGDAVNRLIDSQDERSSQ